jgi:hypothetical protein
MAEPARSGAMAAPGWRLPRPLLVKAARFGAVAFAPLVVAYLVLGPMAATGAGIGVVVGLAVATVLAPLPAAAVIAGHGAVAMLSAAVAGQPLAAAGLVALSGLAAGPANTRGFGKALVLLPVMAMLGSSGLYADDPVRAAAGIVAGGGWALLVARLAGSRPALRPVQLRAAWTHAIVLAATAGVAALAALAIPLPHGYWIVITLSAVLVPVASETAKATLERVGGTIVGALFGVAAGLVLPAILQAVVAVAAVILLIGYALIGDGPRKVAMLTLVLVLALAGVSGTATLDVAIQRLAWTLVAALLVVAAGFLVARVADRTWVAA